MRALCLLSLVLVAPLQRLVAQGEVHVDDRLPPASIELKAGEPPTISAPWQLPKPLQQFLENLSSADVRPVITRVQELRAPIQSALA
jgi:hypothetical protein